MIDIYIDRLKTSLKVLPIVQYHPPKGIRTGPSDLLNPVTESRSEQPVNLYAFGAIVVLALRETPALLQEEFDSKFNYEFSYVRVKTSGGRSVAAAGFEVATKRCGTTFRHEPC